MRERQQQAVVATIPSNNDIDRRQRQANLANSTMVRGSSSQVSLQMSSKPAFRQSRRSTRVSLKLVIEVEGLAQKLMTDGETIVVNLHGALISTATPLHVGLRISVHVYLTDKRAAAHVVYVDEENPLRCGIELEQPQNIWGVSLAPADWHDEY